MYLHHICSISLRLPHVVPVVGPLALFCYIASCVKVLKLILMYVEYEILLKLTNWIH